MTASKNFQIASLATQRQVLIIDDDADFAESLADILDLQGYRQFIANNPFEALKVMEVQCPLVALIDIRLGNSSGIDLIRRIKEKQPETECIIVTAHAELETAISAIQNGAYGYLRKPIEAHDLLTTLDHCFEKIWLQKEKESAEHALKQRNKELEEVNLRLRVESQRTIQALDQLRRSETRYRCLFESAPVGLIDFDLSSVEHDFYRSGLHGVDSSISGECSPSALIQMFEKCRINDVNAETLRMFKLTQKKQYANLFKRLLGSEAHRFNNLVFHQTKRRIEGEIHFQDGDASPMHILMRADLETEKPSGQRMLVSLLDITERKIAEESLEHEQEKFKVLVERAPLGISIFDEAGRFKYFNPKRIELFGYTIDECATIEEWLELAIPVEYRRQVISQSQIDRQVLTNGGVVEPKSLPVNCKDGSTKTILFRLMMLRHGELVELAEDFTQQLRMEEQMAQAQKMEAVGTLAGGVAHDFNNLLQAIQGYSQLLLIDKPADDLETVKLKEIIKASERASELTRQLLAFSRKVESKLKPTDLNQVIIQVNKLILRTIPKMIGIELELDGKISIINADPVQIEQVLMNLAINARDAMPDGGRLIFSTRNVSLDEEFCREHLGLQPGAYVELRITDTGHGLDKETIEHIFEPFFTTKGIGKGTGLGLSMAYGIIRNHGGQIQCISQPGAGATFKIFLPALTQFAAPIEKITEAHLPPGGTETILLVDDEKLLREIGTAILSRFGYTVLSCADGESALELYRAKNSEIALIILDLIMPGMGGKRCLDELLQINPHVKVVISSGYGGENLSPRDFEPVIKGMIKKPYDIKQMLIAIRSILDKP